MRQESGQITLKSYQQHREKYLAGLTTALLLKEYHHGLEQFVNFGQPEIAGRARKLHRAIKTSPTPAQLAEQFAEIEVSFILTPKARNLLTLPAFKGQAPRRHGQVTASA